MAIGQGAEIASPDAVVKPLKKAGWAYKEWHPKDIFIVSAMLFLHALCLFAPFTFSWSAFRLAVVLTFVFGNLGVTLSYHRNLAHQSFKMPKYLEYFFAYLGLLSLQGDPIFWVSAHRLHHKKVDTLYDPHSPVEGFWHSHIGWLFDYNYVMQKGDHRNHARDLSKQWYYRFLRSTHGFHVLLLSAILYFFGGFPYIVWGMGVRTVVSYHGTFLVNSACHIWGKQTWNTGDLSKNNWIVAIFTWGEGWHNNHHAFEFSARQGLEWWQVDTTWYVIKLLEWLGLATDVKVPSEIQKKKMSFETARIK